MLVIVLPMVARASDVQGVSWVFRCGFACCGFGCVDCGCFVGFGSGDS